MLREIVLLTGPREATHLTVFFRRQNPELEVTLTETREDLAVALYPRRPGVRLIAFCTPTVVPADLLGRLDGQAYNFHPGPPTYPGRHPASFAIYEGAKRFGATVHEMVASVDSGPIVGVEWFDMPAAPRLAQVEGMAAEAAVDLLQKFGPHLATSLAPLPPSGDKWSGRPSRQHDFDAMCELTADIDPVELDRRVRAFADGLKGTLYIPLHGHRFRISD